MAPSFMAAFLPSIMYLALITGRRKRSDSGALIIQLLAFPISGVIIEKRAPIKAIVRAVHSKVEATSPNILKLFFVAVGNKFY